MPNVTQMLNWIDGNCMPNRFEILRRTRQKVIAQLINDYVIGKQGFTRFEFKISFGRGVLYGIKPPNFISHKICK